MNNRKHTIETHLSNGYVFSKEFTEEATAIRCFEKLKEAVDTLNSPVTELRYWHNGKTVKTYEYGKEHKL